MNIMLTNSHRWIGLLALASLSGCAQAYQSYPCGCIPYGYCPDRPLPYRTYSGCPTPIASSYSSARIPQPPQPPLPTE